MPRIAEWLKPAETMRLDSAAAIPSNGASKREGILRVRAVDDAPSRATVEEVLQALALHQQLGPREPQPTPTPESNLSLQG